MGSRIVEYDELVLRVGHRGEQDYHVVVTADAVQSSGRARVTMPFDERDLELFVARLGRTRGRTRSVVRTELDEAKKFGSELFDALFTGDVRRVYNDASMHARYRDRGLRIRLQLESPELMAVPWEYIYEGRGFLAQSIYSPVVRSFDLAGVRPTRELHPPLRILALASAPSGQVPLDVAEEKDKLDRALAPLVAGGAITIEWLERATLGELHRVLAAPDEFHVVHYVGHGAYDDRTASGVLILEDEHGLPREVTGEELAWVLRDERSLQLVVLNACAGARVSAVDPFSGVATSLVGTGITAVVGMQFDITDDAAIVFAESFYTAVAQLDPVDAALSRSRMAMWANGHDTEFGTPVLFLRGEETRLFSSTPGQPVAVEPPVRRAPAAREARPEPPAGTDSLTLRVARSRDDEVRVTVAAGDTRRSFGSSRPGIEMFAPLFDYSTTGDTSAARAAIKAAWARLGPNETLYTGQKKAISEALGAVEVPVATFKCARSGETYRRVLVLLTTHRIIWSRESFFDNPDIQWVDWFNVDTIELDTSSGGDSSVAIAGRDFEKVEFVGINANVILLREHPDAGEAGPGQVHAVMANLRTERKRDASAEAGRLLFDKFLPDDLADVFRTAVPVSEGSRSRPKFVVRVDDDLQWLPWELLRDEVRGYVINHADVVRQLGRGRADDERRTLGNLRSALVVTGAHARSDGAADDDFAQRVRNRLRDGRRAAEVAWLHDDDVVGVLDQLARNRYDVVVVDVSFTQGATGGAAVTFGPGRQPVWLSVHEVADAVAAHPPSLLVVCLNTPTSETLSSQGVAVSGLLTALLDVGVGAAIAFDTELPREARLRVASTVLNQAGSDLTADELVRRLREELAAAFPDGWSWADLTLFSR
ncbi:MAG: CHAT domain-containing protein [Actinophytocola sp.]|uniref:CHAT domain-containing protein n=1 Tax=Actinophytocola sp. TaxID=1872138 RepID=UPI003D6AC822